MEGGEDEPPCQRTPSVSPPSTWREGEGGREGKMTWREGEGGVEGGGDDPPCQRTPSLSALRPPGGREREGGRGR